MATRKLEVEFIGNTQNLEKGFKSVRSEADQTQKSVKKTDRAIGAIGATAKVAGGVALGGALVDGLLGAVGAYRDTQRIGRQTNAVIKSTGGVANVSVKHVNDLANAISKKTGVDDEAIQSSENLIATFTNVRNEVGKGKNIFDQATQAALDLSKAGFGDLQSTSKQLGKALNDPKKGLTSLGRAGVQFSDKQKKAINALVETGKHSDLLKAQQLELKEVMKQVGGSAETQATGTDKLKVSLGNLQESVGGYLVPTIDKAAGFMNDLLNGDTSGVKKITDAFAGVHLGGLGDDLDNIKNALVTIGDVAQAIGERALPGVKKWIAGIAQELKGVIEIISGLLTLDFSKVWDGLKDLGGGLLKSIEGMVQAVTAPLREVGSRLGAVIVEGLKALPGAIVDAAVWWLDTLVAGAKAYVESLATLGGWIVGAVVDGLKAAPGLIAEAAKWWLDTLVSGVKLYVSSLASLGGWVVKAIVDGFKDVANLLVDAAKWYFDTLVAGVKAYADAWRSVGSWVVDRVIDGFKTVTDLFGSIGAWLRDKASGLIKAEVAGFSEVGSWVVDKVVDGFTTVTDAVKGVGKWLHDKVEGLIHAVDFGGIGGWVIGQIVSGLEGGANLIIGFVNKIIDALNKVPFLKIPKVPEIKGDDDSGGGKSKLETQGLARGGIVNKPIVMMGEEAPRHPEYVIPTNPAYRDRAKMLLGQAAGAIGFADGGVYGFNQLESIWTGAGGSPSAQAIMAHIAQAESGGNPHAYNPSGASGLWQILGQVVPGDIFNPYINAQNAISKSGNGQNLHPWDASRSAWQQYVGLSGATASGSAGTDTTGILGVLGDVANAVNPLDLLKKVTDAMPDPSNLPGWIDGGSLVKQAVDFAKDKISSIASTLGGGDAAGGAGVVSTTGLVPQVLNALAWARHHGWGGSVTSGLRSTAKQQYLWDHSDELGLIRGVSVAAPGTSSHERGQAVDVTDYQAFLSAMSSAPANSKLLWRGSTDPVHFSITGHAKGGVIGGPAPVEGADTVKRQQGLDLMQRIWGEADAFYGQDGASMPPVKFWDNSMPVVGMSFDAPDKGQTALQSLMATGRMDWPDWVNDIFIHDPIIDTPEWKKANNNWTQSTMLGMLVHEWAHYFQKTNLSLSEAEGGAQLFARRAGPAIYGDLGIPFKNPSFSDDQYPQDMAAVKRTHDTDWIEKGQFRGGDFPYAGSFSGGGVVPGPLGAPALATVHGGEHIYDPRTGSGGGGALVTIQHMEVNDSFDEERFARNMAWQLDNTLRRNGGR